MVPERHVPGDARPHEAEWGQGRGSWEEGETGFRWPLSRGRGTPEREGLQLGEGVSHSLVTPPFLPILTSQTPRFSPVATATAPARRGHQGNPVPASPPLPITGVPPHPKQQWCGRWEGQWGGELGLPTQRGGPNLHPASPPIPASLHPQPHSWIRSDCQTCSPPSLGGGDPPNTELRTSTRPPLPPASALQQAPPTVLCRPPIPEEA